MFTASVPVFRLYLLRHAKAGRPRPGETDFDRALDDTGIAEAELIAGRAADRGFVPDLTVSSTALRCRQTVEAFRRAMGACLDIRYIDTLYAGDENVYRNIITGQDAIASLMLVGHNPVIEEILHESLGEQAAAAIPAGYQTGALAAIDFDLRPQGCLLPRGKLTAFLDPDVHIR